VRASGNSSNDPNAKFTDFMRQLVQMPHSEIKAKLDAEREAKRTSKTSVSRAAVSALKSHRPKTT